MRNIVITEEQRKYLMESLEDSSKIPSWVMRSLWDDEFYLNCNPAFASNLQKKVSKLFLDGRAEVSEHFTDDISSVPTNKIQNKLNKLIARCQKIESPIRERLEELCVRVLIKELAIREDEAIFDVKLQDNIEVGNNIPVYPEDGTNLLNEDYDFNDYDIEEEIGKRQLISMLTIGASMSIYETIWKTVMSDIYELNEELPFLYSKIIRLNNYLLYRQDINIDDKHKAQGGYVNVNIKNNETLPSVVVRANIFPILLIEAIRGVLEIVTTHSLPDNNALARIVVKNTDILTNEPWQMRLGYPLWMKIENSDRLEQISSSEIPCLFYVLSKMPIDSLVHYLVDKTFDKEIGEIDELILKKVKDLNRSIEYELFLNKIDDRNADFDKEQLITDEYFSDSET